MVDILRVENDIIVLDDQIYAKWFSAQSGDNVQIDDNGSGSEEDDVGGGWD